jgi:hypothetical protein
MLRWNPLGGNGLSPPDGLKNNLKYFRGYPADVPPRRLNWWHEDDDIFIGDRHRPLRRRGRKERPDQPGSLRLPASLSGSIPAPGTQKIAKTRKNPVNFFKIPRLDPGLPALAPRACLPDLALFCGFCTRWPQARQSFQITTQSRRRPRSAPPRKPRAKSNHRAARPRK